MVIFLSIIGGEVHLVAKTYLRWVEIEARSELLLLSLPFYFGSTLIYFLSLVADQLLASLLVVLLFPGFEADLDGLIGALFEIWSDWLIIIFFLKERVTCVIVLT